MNIEQDVSLELLKALADASRLRLIRLLAKRERNVEELAVLLDLRAPTVSHHLNRLRAVGLLRMRAEGTSHLYQLDTDALRTLTRRALAFESLTAVSETEASEAGLNEKEKTLSPELGRG